MSETETKVDGRKAPRNVALPEAAQATLYSMVQAAGKHPSAAGRGGAAVIEDALGVGADVIHAAACGAPVRPGTVKLLMRLCEGTIKL